MPDANKIRITMLGTTGSGKTMYLLGLYAVMSAGLDGYSLHARDLDLDIDMTEAWEALADAGELPEATTETKPYELAFQRGFTKLIDIDWSDYRGGAMSDRGKPEDTRNLVATLADTDSVYLTVDGSKLIGGVGPHNVVDVRKATLANLMANHLRRAADARGDIPSIVVLITKSDLLIAGASSPTQALDDATESMRLLLPVAFEEGATTMVCPVTLGDLGAPLGENRIDASRVSPRWVQKPIIFSLARYFQSERALSTSAIRDHEGDVAAEQQALVDLRGKMFGSFRKGRAQQIEMRLTEARRALDSQRQLVERATDRDRRLMDQLDGPRFFVDGVETEFVHG